MVLPYRVEILRLIREDFFQDPDLTRDKYWNVFIGGDYDKYVYQAHDEAKITGARDGVLASCVNMTYIVSSYIDEQYQQTFYRKYDDMSEMEMLEWFADYGDAGLGHDYKLLVKFIALFIQEIRDIICNKQRHTEASRLTNKRLSPVAAALATLVLGHFNVAEPLAIGAATYILVVIMEASKGAFCTATDSDILDKLREVERRQEARKRKRGLMIDNQFKIK